MDTTYYNLYNGNIELIKNFIENEYEPGQDRDNNHPILHEIAHQAGNCIVKIVDNCDENYDWYLKTKKRFQGQNEVFKYLFSHVKFKKLLHNRDYTDKYGYTAMERLRVSYNNYNSEKLKNWIKNNLMDIEKVKLLQDIYYSDEYKFTNSYLFEDVNKFVGVKNAEIGENAESAESVNK